MASTKKGLTARVAAGFGAVALATLTALGGALPASAVGPNVDSTAEGRISIHKYMQPETPGQPSNGLPVTTLDPAGALEGVQFTVELVPGTDLTTAEGWLRAEELRTDANGIATARTAIDAQVPAPSAPTAVATDSKGLADFAGLELGVYLVTERADLGGNSIVLKSEPFLVTVPMAHPTDPASWLYHVNVYPKNAVASIEKDVDDSRAFELGDTVTWPITVQVPELPAGEIFSEFVITDQLDERLSYTDAAVEGPAGLLASHYDVTHLDGLVTVTFNLDGRAFLSTTNGAEIVVTVSTTVDAVANGVDAEHGIISNQAVVTINGVPTTSDVAATRWGLLEVRKLESGTARLLAGAVFELYAVDPASTGAAPIFTTRPTGADGIATFPALREDVDYWIVETVAPLGYEIGELTTPVQVNAGTPTAVVVDFPNTKIPPYALPITGGSGQAAFMIGGAGLILGALGFALLRRRKAQAGA